MGRYHIYLRSGAKIVLRADRIEFDGPRDDKNAMLPVYTSHGADEPDHSISILLAEVIAVIGFDDRTLN